MDIFSILSQPNGAADPAFFCSNYRQIAFEVLADSVVTPNQPMYCDVYINSVFYKTMSSYSIDADPMTGNGIYIFDIQDALQESLSTFLNIPPTSGAIYNTFQLALTQCYFRGSDITAGILTPNPVVPIQATATTPAVSGTGTPSELFYVLNSTLLPEFQNIFSNNLETLLNQKKSTYLLTLPGTRVYSLSNMPILNIGYLLANIPIAPKVYAADNGQFPIVIAEFGTSGILSNFHRNCELVLLYWSSDLIITAGHVMSGVSGIDAGYTYYIPIGLKDILTAAPSLASVLTSSDNDMYYSMGVFDVDSGTYCYFSPLFYARNKVVQGESYRLWFQNNYGNFDQLTFIRSSEDHKSVSSELFIPYTETYVDTFGSFNALAKGRKRFNVRGFDEWTLTVTVAEASMPWLKELFDSPYIWQQNPNTTSGFFAVKIVDGTQTTRRSVKDGRVNYEVSIKVTPAINQISIRN